MLYPSKMFHTYMKVTFFILILGTTLYVHTYIRMSTGMSKSLPQCLVKCLTCNLSILPLLTTPLGAHSLSAWWRTYYLIDECCVHYLGGGAVEGFSEKLRFGISQEILRTRKHTSTRTKQAYSQANSVCMYMYVWACINTSCTVSVSVHICTVHTKGRV